MGIKLRKEKSLPFKVSPRSKMSVSRSKASLPPLRKEPHQSNCITHSLTECRGLAEISKLPTIESPRRQSSSRDRRFLGPFNSNSISFVSEVSENFEDNDISINVTEPGFEEAEGITQSESVGQIYGDEREQPSMHLDAEITQISAIQNLDLCGVPQRPGILKLKSHPAQIPLEHAAKLQELLPRHQQQGVGLTMKGSRAKCQPRPVAVQAVTSRPIVNQSTNRIPPKRGASRDNMVSMEERLARSAKADAIRRSKSEGRLSSAAAGRSKKPRRAKTARTRPRKNVCLLTCIKPSNIESEKAKFMKSNYTYNPQFKYEFPASANVLSRFSKATTRYMPQAMAIMKRVLERYGNYEKFEWATGGQLLTKTQLWSTVKRYLEKEGFYGDVVVNISNDLIARAAMTVNGGRPTLSIRESAAKKLWVEGLLRHEIGTHHLRFHNNRQQVWHSLKVRRQMGLKPANPTEEGLASLHSVLLRKDPSLWRSAILYYAIYQASQMSFCELFNDLGQYMENPEVRWDYCLRCKRGQYDTSKPGCFSKDQVYLTGILQLLQIRHKLDFHLLCTMGKISHEDMEMLKPHYNPENTKIPGFMEDLSEYRARLDHIVEVNGLSDWLDETSETSGCGKT